MEKAEQRAAADHARAPEVLGSISDTWRRVRRWGGGVSSGAHRLLGTLIGAAGLLFMTLFGFQGSAIVLGWC